MNTKSILAPFLAAASAFCLTVLPTTADTYGPYTYTDNVVGITINDYNGAGGALAIPAKIAGKPVTTIGDWAFNECYHLTSVTIPSSVTFIGKNAFGFCHGMTKVAIPDSVTYIGDGAFHDCSGLTSIVIPNRLTTINNEAFGSCAGLSHIDIPSSVSRISWFAFSGCTGLTSVTISPNVNFIGEYAFTGCSSLRLASFLGNAPEMERASSIFSSATSNFTMTYLQGKKGFTTPTWNGYPCVVLKPAPIISVQQLAGSKLTDGKSKVSFGSVRIGKSAAKIFIIKNIGTAKLRMDGFTIAGNPEFSIIFPSRKSLPPGASTTFKLTFKPTAVGIRNTEIIIESNDANENYFDFKLTGRGKAP